MGGRAPVGFAGQRRVAAHVSGLHRSRVRRGQRAGPQGHPDFAPYGKRIIRDPGGYYAALAREHVDVEASEPARVNQAGIVTADGRQIDLDVIIYATGYYLDFLSTVDIRGRDGKLTDEWGDAPRAYRGGMVPGFPNMFISSAPNYSPGHGAGHNFGVEVMVHYVMECLQLMALRRATTVEVTQRAYEEYVADIDALMAGTVWCHTPSAHTYYRSGGGRIVTAFPIASSISGATIVRRARKISSCDEPLTVRQNGVGHR